LHRTERRHSENPADVGAGQSASSDPVVIGVIVPDLPLATDNTWLSKLSGWTCDIPLG